MSLLLEVVLLQRGDAVPLGLFAVFSLTELGTAHPLTRGLRRPHLESQLHSELKQLVTVYQYIFNILLQ